MNLPPEKYDLAAEEQASLWAARIEGRSLEAADLAALDVWLAEDPAHRPLLAHYCQFSAELEQRLPVIVAAGAVAMPSMKTPAPRRWQPKWIAAAALAAVAGFAVWAAWPGRKFEDFATRAAERRTLTLADGTVVNLNARTHLLVENGRGERRVRLTEGEAFFSVTKDKTRPFVVETPAGLVRVTGTKFDVRTDTPTELEVTVVEGSVQVRPEKTSGALSPTTVTLLAGDRFTVDARGTTIQALPAAVIEAALAWREGKIVFDGVPLRRALAQFARYDGRTITVAPEVANNKVGGQFNLDDLDGFLTSLQKPDFPVRVTQDPSGEVRVTHSADP